MRPVLPDNRNNSSVCACYMNDQPYGNECQAQDQGACSPNNLTAGKPIMSGTKSAAGPASHSPRPALKSQQSTSLPSTPNQRPRDRASLSISPSGKRNVSNPSPRTHHSDSLPLPSRRPNGGCKYETGMANAKRRVPYSLGPDKLEPASEVPRGFLSAAEDERLTNDMKRLYNMLLPSRESEARRKRLVEKLEMILRKQWPGYRIKVNVFGSTGNKLGTTESDVDICITTDCKELEQVCVLAEFLANQGMQRVVCVSVAKVPIVKIWDPDLKLACDMNVNNPVALENTQMIRAYVEIDDRVRPLAMIIKHWTKRRVLNEAGR
jgi:predicted nucleotidyltransferase